MKRYSRIRFLVIFTVLTLGALALTRVGEASAQGQAVHLAPAFEVFPGTVYDTPFTHSYGRAHGTVVLPSGEGSNPFCQIVANGLKASTNYTVYSDGTGITPGAVGTAGPWVSIGNFETNKGGHGDFRCPSPMAPGTSVFINETDANLTVLISENVP